jgi:streptothricin hydrolase
MTVLEDQIAAARQAGALVVFLQDVGDLDSTVPQGSRGRDLALATERGDLIVPKEVDDGFVGTGLESALREHGVESICATGIKSEMCVAATARGALARGFGVVLPRDGHSTHDIAASSLGVAVPAAQVSRVAEWSLGDEIVVVDRVADVTFESSLPSA